MQMASKGQNFYKSGSNDRQKVEAKKPEKKNQSNFIFSLCFITFRFSELLSIKYYEKKIMEFVFVTVMIVGH